MKLLATTLLLTACLFAQTKSPVDLNNGVTGQGPKPLTAEEKNALSRAEVRTLRAGAALQAAQQESDAANQSIGEVINKIYGERKIQLKDYALCENPTPGPCEHAPSGDLTLQPVKRAEDKK